MFHTHLFKPSDSNPEIIYCHCGQVKDLHQHNWVEVCDLTRTYLNGTRGLAYIKMQCKKCGELKLVEVE